VGPEIIRAEQILNIRQPAGSPMREQPRRKSVLIVDDDAQFIFALRKVLLRADYAISDAGNGVDALELLRTHSFDLAITDHRMAPLSGLELISIIRGQGIRVPILLMTAFADEEWAANAKKAGADACFKKPAKRGEILRCVSKLLSLENNVS
jgi:CheY-like chemotaxis protein